MFNLLKIAVRNIFRQKRRNLLNISAIVVGITLLLITLCFFEGWIQYTISILVTRYSGNIQIENKDYERNSRRFPLDINIKDTEKIISLVSNVKDVLCVSPRIDFNAYLSGKTGKIYLVGRAIEPEREAKVTKIKEQIVKGRYLEIDKAEILISKSTAEKLGLKVGDYIIVNAINKYGNTNPMDFRVAGIFNFNYPMMDDRYFFIDYNAAQNLLFTDGNATHLVLKIKKGASTKRVIKRIENVLPVGSHLVVKGWQEFGKALISEIYGDTVSTGIMILFMLIIVVFTILNTMSMAVNERRAEIGTLRSIGMKRGGILRMFILESLILGIIGGCIAIIISLCVNIPLSHMDMHISVKWAEVMKGLPISGKEPLSGYTALWHYILGFGLALLCSLIGGILPARKAARMKPVDALKTRA